jgi:DNA processing protein
VTEPRDVLDALAPQLARGSGGLTERAGPDFAPGPPIDGVSSRPEPGDAERQRVLSLLGPHPIDVDEIVRATALGAREVRILLMELDLAGEIVRHGHQLVSRAVR